MHIRQRDNKLDLVWTRCLHLTGWRLQAWDPHTVACKYIEASACPYQADASVQRMTRMQESVQYHYSCAFALAQVRSTALLSFMPLIFAFDSDRPHLL